MPASARANVLVDATRLSAWITVVRAERLLEVDHPVSVPVIGVMNVGRLSHPVGRTRAANAQHAVRTGEISRSQDGGYRLRGKCRRGDLNPHAPQGALGPQRNWCVLCRPLLSVSVLVSPLLPMRYRGSN
jgi:hypothetical protein